MIKRLILALLAPLLINCASTNLNVAVDVYSEDPILQIQVESAKAAVTDATSTSGEIVTVRKTLAKEFINIYDAYLELTAVVDGGNRTSAGVDRAVRELANLIPNYDLRLAEQYNDLQLAASEAADRLDQPTPTNWLSSVRNVDLKFKPLAGGNLGSNFEEQTTDIVEIISADLGPGSKLANATLSDPNINQALINLLNKLEEVAVTTEVLTETGFKVGIGLSESIDMTRESIENNEWARASRNLDAALTLAMETSARPGFGMKGQSVIAQLGNSWDFYTSQIDRLQDPADPAWRILTAAGNEDKWNEDFTTTQFYAEGEAEVILVRDRLGHFRVQRGQNDPTALIEGQLRISRSLASGLVDIVAAAAGVNGVPGLSGNKILTGDELPDPSTGNFGLEDEEARAKSAHRYQSNLRQELESIRQAVAATPDGQPVSQKEQQRISATLRVYEALLSATKDTAK